MPAQFNEEELVAEQSLAPGMCVECGDQPGEVFCEQCQDDFCSVCFAAQHRRGQRRRHTTRPVGKAAAAAGGAAAAASSNDAEVAAGTAAPEAPAVDVDEAEPGSPAAADSPLSGPEAAGEGAGTGSSTAASAAPGASSSSSAAAAAPRLATSTGALVAPGMRAPAPVPMGADLASLPPVGEWYVNRARSIPLRLTLAERKKLRLVEAALEVSEYTDKVDIISFQSKSKGIHAQLKEMCAILTGLQVASDYRRGKELCQAPEFKANADFFRDHFEVARRHKIRNPEKMRSAYGKLVHLLMDSQQPDMQELLEFSMVMPLRTVYTMLEERESLDLLRDPLLTLATAEIKPHGKTRPQINAELKRKERALEALVNRHTRGGRISPDDVRTAVGSIGDNFNFLRYNSEPVEQMIEYLRSNFDPDSSDPEFSLAIQAGGGKGARLTHSHKVQYYYALQSLMLWRDILFDFFALWCCAEDDLLDPRNVYRLRNTGQGLNRVQECPRVSRAVHNVLHHTQQKVGAWVGSSVVHLGDSNVPNSLIFIDKYTQVSRILTPVVTTLRKIDEIRGRPGLARYVDETFGGAERLRLLILTDFFRHAFDGSGADNFFSAGSCIDGRLTSAWNWCQQIDKKPYYPIFVLAGFVGFDGEW